MSARISKAVSIAVDDETHVSGLLQLPACRGRKDAEVLDELLDPLSCWIGRHIAAK